MIYNVYDLDVQAYCKIYNCKLLYASGNEYTLLLNKMHALVHLVKAVRISHYDT